MSISKDDFSKRDSPPKLVIQDMCEDTVEIEQRETGGVYITARGAVVVEGFDLIRLIAVLDRCTP